MRRPGSIRSLEEDVRDLRAIGIGAIVSLTEIALDDAALKAEGMTSLRVPVPDFHPPSLSDVRKVISFITSSLELERPVVVHCTAGLGRTGTILACWLVNQGEAPDTAIQRVRAMRPGSIETWEQEQRIFDYAAYLSGAES